MIRLEDHFSKIAAQLPTDPETNLTLSAANCPALPDELETDQLLLRASPLGRNYGDSARYDLLDFFAEKPTYRALGLMLFSGLFHQNPEVTLHLRHEDASVTKIVLKRQVSGASGSELPRIPVASSLGASKRWACRSQRRCLALATRREIGRAHV